MSEHDLDTPGPQLPPERWPGEHTEVKGDGGPGYAGKWGDMTPAQQSAYMHARKAWKDAQPDAQHKPGREGRGTGARDGSTGAATPSDPQALDIQLLDAIASDPKALRSDRIRAIEAKARILRGDSEGVTDAAAHWLAARDALLTLPPHDRLAWLLGAVGEEEEEGGGHDDQEDEGGWAVPPSPGPAGGPSPRGVAGA